MASRLSQVLAAGVAHLRLQEEEEEEDGLEDHLSLIHI